MEIDQGIISMVILSLPLILEGQLSVSGEECEQVTVNPLEEGKKVWLGELTLLNMTLMGWLGRKTSKQTNKNLIKLPFKEQFDLGLHCLLRLVLIFRVNMVTGFDITWKLSAKEIDCTDCTNWHLIFLKGRAHKLVLIVWKKGIH